MAGRREVPGLQIAGSRFPGAGESGETAGDPGGSCGTDAASASKESH
jgi:hypothetical protein